MRRVGILVSRDGVRALVVRSGRVVWHAHAPIPASSDRQLPDHGVTVALDEVLSTLPRTRIGRTTVRVAIGLAHSDYKRIEGLPPTRQPKR